MFNTRKELKELKLFINEMEEQHKKRIQELEQIEKETNKRLKYLQSDIITLYKELFKIENEKNKTTNK
nr:MAG TPA: Sensory rhodopsin II transducer, Chemotaxis, Chromophore, Membrane, Methylation [Caudoviricetes sp.]